MTLIRAATLSTILGVAVFASACSPGTQHAQRHEQQHDISQMHSGHMQQMQSMTPVQRQYHEAMHKMHQAMMRGMMEPDPAASWLKMMAAHHQGAIDMSEVIIRNTSDPVVIAKAQETKQDAERDLQKIQRMGK